MSGTKKYPEAGDWVLVWGQVQTGPTHPEDVVVEFTSHSAQYSADVRTDRVKTVKYPPEFLGTCTAMFRFASGVNGLFVRCVRHEGHGKRHRDRGGTKYAESQVVGYIEEA